MNYISHLVILIGFYLLTSIAPHNNASLTIKNDSQRVMTLKVMKGNHSNNELHESLQINAFDEATVYFSQSGNYFIKTKAVLRGKEPIYQRGQIFNITNDHTGYSVMTITFSISESATPQVTGGKQISKTEFDKN